VVICGSVMYNVCVLKDVAEGEEEVPAGFVDE